MSLMNGLNLKRLRDAVLVSQYKSDNGCIGPHSDEKPEDSEFWRSSTVAHASNGKDMHTYHTS